MLSRNIPRVQHVHTRQLPNVASTSLLWPKIDVPNDVLSLINQQPQHIFNLSARFFNSIFNSLFPNVNKEYFELLIMQSHCDS